MKQTQLYTCDADDNEVDIPESSIMTYTILEDVEGEATVYSRANLCEEHASEFVRDSQKSGFKTITEEEALGSR